MKSSQATRNDTQAAASRLKIAARLACVSLEARKETCASALVMARMHSLSASSDLLISAPSVRSCREWLLVSWPRSDPARSTTYERREGNEKEKERKSNIGCNYGAWAAQRRP